jgi:hypothetical protein
MRVPFVDDEDLPEEPETTQESAFTLDPNVPFDEHPSSSKTFAESWATTTTQKPQRHWIIIAVIVALIILVGITLLITLKP